MWMPRSQTDRREGGNGLVAVAIDKDKNSQYALKWATDHLLQRGQTIILIHVKLKPALSASPSIATLRMNQVADSNALNALVCKEPDSQTKELFLPFRCFCTRKDIQCKDIVMEDTDIGRALIEYVTHAAIEVLLLGASAKTGLFRYPRLLNNAKIHVSRFKTTDIPGTVSKGAPDFCTVYVISKGKIQSMRSASRPAPSVSPLINQVPNQQQPNPKPAPKEVPISQTPNRRVGPKTPTEQPQRSTEETEFFRAWFLSQQSKKMESAKFQIEKFDGNNFGFWKMQMEDYLYQRNLHEPLSGMKPETMRQEVWDLKDRQALGLIHLSLARNIVFNIVKETTTAGVLKALSNMYEKPSAINKVYLMRRLFNLEMSESGSVADHINEFNMIISQLSSVDINFDDEIRALILMSSLPESWDTVVSAISSSRGSEKLRFDEVRDVVLSESIRKREIGDSSGNALSVENRYIML